MAGGNFIKQAARFTFGVVVKTVLKPREIVETIKSAYLETLSGVHDRTHGRRDLFEVTPDGRPTPAASKLQDRKIDTSPSHAANRAMVDQLLALYAEAWKNKYESVRVRHKMKHPDSEYVKTRWHQHKSAMKAARAKAPHSDRVTNYSMQSLMSGFLRLSLGRSFGRGGDQYLRMGNPMLEGGFSPQWDAYHTPYPPEFENWLRGNEILGKEEDLVDFSQQDWGRITAHVKTMWESGWADELVEALNRITLKV